MSIFVVHFVRIYEQISKDVMKTFVIYLFSILWTVIGLSNSEQEICKEGAADKTVAPVSYITNSLSASNHILCTTSFEAAASSSVSSYATKNNSSAKEDAKHKSHNKSAILGQRFCKLNSIHYSDALSSHLISPEGALYVLAFLCRLNI